MVLGRSQAYLDGLETLLGPLWAVLGRSWDLCGRSWAALGTSVRSLGPHLAPLRGVLGRSRAFVGGLGPSWAEKWPWPEREGDLAGGSRPKSSPNPSRSGLQQEDVLDVLDGLDGLDRSALGAQYHFSIDRATWIGLDSQIWAQIRQINITHCFLM